MSKRIEVEGFIEDGKLHILDIKGVSGEECTKVAEKLRQQLSDSLNMSGKMEKTASYSRGSTKTKTGVRQNTGGT